jgi:hypothetical protein
MVTTVVKISWSMCAKNRIDRIICYRIILYWMILDFTLLDQKVADQMLGKLSNDQNLMI